MDSYILLFKSLKDRHNFLLEIKDLWKCYKSCYLQYIFLTNILSRKKLLNKMPIKFIK